MRWGPPLLLGLAAACGGVADESKGPPAELTQLPRALSAPEIRLIEADNRFGFALFQEVRRGAPTDNIFLSPLSAGMVLGMTLNGAAGVTAQGMRQALRLDDAPLAEINAGYRSLLDLLGGLDPTTDFRIANSIWAEAGFPFRASFLDAGRTSFDAEVRSLDLQAPASLGIINDWVKDRTGGKIPRILDQVASDEVMFLINAMYFKGKWRLPFDPKQTHSAPFHTADGTTQSVPTMHRDPEILRYAVAPDHEIVELWYGNGSFALTIVLPPEGGTLDNLAAGLDAERWAEWIGGLRDLTFALALPKFRLEYQRDLQPDLSALGMAAAFDPNAADFGAMGDPGAPPLYLSRALQKTFVDVNEEGTEAAAATVVGVGVTSLPATISIDRPFLFAIRERLSGTVFFLGQITRIP